MDKQKSPVFKFSAHYIHYIHYERIMIAKPVSFFDNNVFYAGEQKTCFKYDIGLSSIKNNILTLNKSHYYSLLSLTLANTCINISFVSKGLGNLWYLQLENKSKTLIPSTVPGKISNIKTRCFFTFQSSWEWIFYEINFWKREVRIFMC